MSAPYKLKYLKSADELNQRETDHNIYRRKVYQTVGQVKDTIQSDMSREQQTPLDPKKKVETPNQEDTDDSATLAPSTITYSRNNGSFTVDDGSTVHNGVEPHIDPAPLRSNGASPMGAQDKILSSQLSQWNYNHNRIMLNRGILHVIDILHEMELENRQRPMHVLQDNENQLHVLTLQVKVDGNYGGSNFDLDKEAMAKLFKSQIMKSLAHLKSLKKRVDDVSSKVFITGDVNTGKSSFCNSLLKRRLLPEDQLPCTNVFCEILEARENSNREEVHAILLKKAHSVKDANSIYNIKDISSYEIHKLEELNELVQESEKYALLKIYIKDDQRPPEQSLLRNGTVDISLIDSPGLNMDSIQTSEVMARQEEIDLVIFIVNAENQLTLSAKEFITLASREKKLMFFVVKKFDKIKDKKRCKELILKQIKDLSPESYKSSSEFVHFISNDAGDDDEPNNDSDPYADDGPDPDFDNLENSLRNFVLKRRSLSKLLPAKTYLCKLLSDVQKISENNMNIYQKEGKEIKDDLKLLEPELKEIKTRCDSVTATVDKIVETTLSCTYDYTVEKISNSLTLSTDYYPKYEGLSRIYEYIISTEHFMKSQIIESLRLSEEFAKNKTEGAVKEINDFGKTEMGDDFMSNRVFNKDLMFSRKLHSTVRELSVPLGVSDLFAPSWEGFFSYLSWGIFSPVSIKSKDISAIENADQNALMKASFRT